MSFRLLIFQRPIYYPTTRPILPPLPFILTMVTVAGALPAVLPPPPPSSTRFNFQHPLPLLQQLLLLLLLLPLGLINLVKE